MAFLTIAWWHRHGDGLWFQGDAPRHAMNGFLWWDLLTTLPRHPIDFTLRYYARYPVIAPVTYPPLFYVIEGAAFAGLGPSPYVARAIVLAFGIMVGLYTMAWSRRWIDETAGWSGAFVAFTPGLILWSNTVMLNVPATALSITAIYYFRRWLESGATAAFVFTTASVCAALLTYYPNAVILPVLGACALVHWSDARITVKQLAAAGLMACLASIPLFVIVLMAPVHTWRHVPTISFLLHAKTWTDYWVLLPRATGVPALVVGCAGVLASIVTGRLGRETGWLIVWIVVWLAASSLAEARDARYVLPMVSPVVIAGAIGIVILCRTIGSVHPSWAVAALTATCVASAWQTTETAVPEMGGFREFVAYVRAQPTTDVVLYDGEYDGVVGFYLRASDPAFERRFVRADKTLYSYGPGTTFDWRQTSTVQSVDDIIKTIRSRLGCQLIAIEVPRPTGVVLGRRLLREALKRPEFEFVKTFVIRGTGDRRVDLYRFRDAVRAVDSVDLSFPALTDRQFLNVVPIVRSATPERH